MNDYPEPVQQLLDAIKSMSGVKEVTMGMRGLAGLGERELSFPGEFGDLPHLAIRRTKGGQKDELLVTAEIRFYQNYQGWIALEFLAWWVRDQSRGGQNVQMRPLALPPKAYGTQLGRTLKFVIEFFFINPNEDNSLILDEIGKLGDSLQSNVKDYYVKELANPTQAEHGDLESLRRCAENDDFAAQLHLAHCYENGQGTAEDKGEAFRWYERAAKYGHPHAKFCLGKCYRAGMGVEINPKLAFECFSEAARGGDAEAMGYLGNHFENGTGTVKDLARAVEWYQRGAKNGDPVCQAEFGECLEFGKGVDKDLQEALKWYRQALAQGFEPVQPAIDRLEAALK